MSEAGKLTVDASLIKKYDRAGPRYTSYPTVPAWSHDYTGEQADAALARANLRQGAMSLYLHLPFCRQKCHFCGCNMVVDKDRKLTGSLPGLIKQDLARMRSKLPDRNQLIQIHLGGGTPTWSSPEELSEILGFVHDNFEVLDECEKSIEVHPSVTKVEHLDVLQSFAFERISMGVQDFDMMVQELIHRPQPFEMTKQLIMDARARGFKSVNLDLIYGLPAQTPERFHTTIEKVVELLPERIALYSYAHLPARFKHQGLMPAELLPSAEMKLEIFLQARQQLLDAGYIAIGMDHFVLPSDEMAIAYQNGQLQRNFMGYSTRAGAEMLAVGPSAISMFDDAYFQQNPNWAKWRKSIEAGVWDIKTGIDLTSHDQIIRDVIMGWMCRGMMDLKSLKEKYPGIEALVAPGGKELSSELISPLVELVEQDMYRTTPLGDLFLRNIALNFDPSINGDGEQLAVKFSRTVSLKRISCCLSSFGEIARVNA